MKGNRRISLFNLLFTVCCVNCGRMWYLLGWNFLLAPASRLHLVLSVYFTKKKDSCSSGRKSPGCAHGTESRWQPRSLQENRVPTWWRFNAAEFRARYPISVSHPKAIFSQLGWELKSTRFSPCLCNCRAHTPHCKAHQNHPIRNYWELFQPFYNWPSPF